MPLVEQEIAYPSGIPETPSRRMPLEEQELLTPFVVIVTKAL
jgi:hypothetical protein